MSLKIALIDPSLFTWPYDSRLARGLIENGHEAVIYGRDPGAALPSNEESLLCRHFYPGLASSSTTRLPQKLFLGLKGLSHIESMVRLVRRFRRDRPDVIHFQWLPLPLVDRHFLSALRRIAPLILTVHDSVPFNDSPKIAVQARGAIDIMRRFDRLIVHTAIARRRLESYGLDPERIHVIPHGPLLEIDPAQIAAADAAARERDHVTLLLFGWIKPYKGTDILLKAIARLPNDLRRICRVRIVGRPQMPMAPLHALVAELGIADQVRFDLRFVPEAELPTLLLDADIQVFPYRAIDASGVLMLALAAGRPIVASRLGLFDEILEDGCHGALVAPNDVDALANALAQLVADAEYRRRCGQVVRALGRGIPRWEEIAKKTLKLYNNNRNVPPFSIDARPIDALIKTQEKTIESGRDEPHNYI